mmetsp:Transcript_10556/g.30153  ORF Transcript_10556/g.30153 Transcript_10556/m.30153 type:complete len:229 (+) Transcript_10556:2438-3124(+)
MPTDISSSMSSAVPLFFNQSSALAISAALFSSSVIWSNGLGARGFEGPDDDSSSSRPVPRLRSQSNALPKSLDSAPLGPPCLVRTESIFLKLATVSSSTSVFVRSQSRALSRETGPSFSDDLGIRESIFLNVATEKATDISSSMSSSASLLRSQSRALAISCARFSSSVSGPDGDLMGTGACCSGSGSARSSTVFQSKVSFICLVMSRSIARLLLRIQLIWPSASGES